MFLSSRRFFTVQITSVTYFSTDIAHFGIESPSIQYFEIWAPNYSVSLFIESVQESLKAENCLVLIANCRHFVLLLLYTLFIFHILSFDIHFFHTFFLFLFAIFFPVVSIFPCGLIGLAIPFDVVGKHGT